MNTSRNTDFIYEFLVNKQVLEASQPNDLILDLQGLQFNSIDSELNNSCQYVFGSIIYNESLTGDLQL